MLAEEIEESTGRGRERFAADANDAEGADDVAPGRHVERHRPERSGRDFPPDRRLREECDAGVDLDGPLDRLDVVELQHDIRLGPVGRKDSVEFVADDEIGVEADKGEMIEVVETDRVPGSERVGGAQTSTKGSSRHGSASRVFVLRG